MTIFGLPFVGFWFPFLGWHWVDCTDFVEYPEVSRLTGHQVSCFGFEWFGMGFDVLMDMDNLRKK